jgi:hypothetical protein
MRTVSEIMNERFWELEDHKESQHFSVILQLFVTLCNLLFLKLVREAIIINITKTKLTEN